MLILLTLAATAALAVLSYNHLKHRDPDLDSSAVTTVQQLAAVIAVLTTAVEGILAALRDPQPATARGRGWDAWDFDGDGA